MKTQTDNKICGYCGLKEEAHQDNGTCRNTYFGRYEKFIPQEHDDIFPKEVYGYQSQEVTENKTDSRADFINEKPDARKGNHSQEISEKQSKEPARVSPDALRGNHSPMPPIVQKEYNRLLKKHPQTKQDVLIREWFKGFKDGESSVLEFLEDMKGLSFKEEYNSWAQADEYTKLNGEVVKRYE